MDLISFTFNRTVTIAETVITVTDIHLAIGETNKAVAIPVKIEMIVKGKSLSNKAPLYLKLLSSLDREKGLKSIA